MRLVACLSLVVACGCGGGDFQVPPQPDARVSLDLAVNTNSPSSDAACLSMVCGACSDRANWDGKPTAEGDPCNWNGTWQCNGASLQCSSGACLPCTQGSGAQPVTGTICGADGHTILELVYAGGSCAAYDFGSSIDVCNRKPNDGCVATCSKQGSGSFACVAHCLSDDGGTGGHPYSPTDTCQSLSM